MNEWEASDPAKSFGQFALFVVILMAMIGTFGSWRRGLESLGVGETISFPFAIIADIILVIILLGAGSAWSTSTQPRLQSRNEWNASCLIALISLGARIGVLYLYGWISKRAGGDWWDLF